MARILSESNSSEEAEIARIVAAYRERDAIGPSHEYSWTNPTFAAYRHQLESEVLRALRDGGVELARASVLDVGCGSGYMLHRFAEYGAPELHGIDLMDARVGEAHRRYPTLQVRQGSATALPYGDESFDLVTQFTCLSSVLDAQVRARIATEMWRVLRPGGAVLSFDLRPPSLPLRALVARNRWRARRPARARTGASTPVQPLPATELERLFPEVRIVSRSLILHPALAALTRGRPLPSQLLATLPPLRSHLIAVIHKPAKQG